MKKVLLVDDKEENLYFLEMLLKNNGFEIIKAENGKEGLDIFHKNKPDLVITDILMPVMDGFTMCKKIREEELQQNTYTPIIFYTATYTSAKDEELAMKIGADAFIIKPCEPDVFLEKINKVLTELEKKEFKKAEEAEEEEVLKLYNERLIRKLEKKMMDLEKEVEARKIAEETLKVSEQKYRSLYNAINDPILVENKDRVIIECNDTFLKVFGYKKDEIINRSVRILYPSDETFDDMGLKIFESPGKSFIQEIELCKSDGTKLPVEANISYLKMNNDFEWIIAIFRDLTERKNVEKKQRELEAQLFQAQKMESIGRLASGIAHDFNNILMAIISCSELLMYSITDEDLLKQLKQIYDAGIKGTDLTKKLLTFSKSQSKEMKPIDINFIIREYEKMIFWSLGKGIQFKLELWPEELIINADSSEIGQVLINMAVNARDAMDGNGVFTIKTELAAKISIEDKNKLKKYALITVSDTGVGIDKSIQDKIFEPFFTTKGGDKGTGLGLYTSYSIVKQHGGFIEVDSEVGKGATFKIYLPIL